MKRCSSISLPEQGAKSNVRKSSLATGEQNRALESLPPAGRFLEPFPDDEKRSYVSLETMIRIIEGNHTYDSTKSYVSSEQIIRMI